MGRRKRALLWVLLLLAAVASYLVMKGRYEGSSSSVPENDHAPGPTPTEASIPPARAPIAPSTARDATRCSIAVHVDGCSGPAHRAHASAEVGGVTVAGNTDRQGDVTLVVPCTPSAALVRARMGRWAADPVVTSNGVARVRVCAGGRLHGRVLDSAGGAAQAGVALDLLDAAGGIVDSVATSAAGTYVLEDPDLAATAVWIGGQVERVVIEPLGPGEDRELDLLLGDVREIVGWVLDVRGEPQAGVRVAMRAEQVRAAWATTTDARGSFVFRRAPASVVHLRADGGERGTGTLVVYGAGEARREVELVLEPAGNLIVHAPPDVAGTVIVRSIAPGEGGSDAEARSSAELDARIASEALAEDEARIEALEVSHADALAEFDRRHDRRPRFPAAHLSRFSPGVVVTGATDTPISVSAQWEHLVELELVGGELDGFRIECGMYRVPAGQTVEVECGAFVPMAFAGRVVDVAGMPLAGMEVAAPLLASDAGSRAYIDCVGRANPTEDGRRYCRQVTTGSDGRFVLSGFGRGDDCQVVVWDPRLNGTTEGSARRWERCLPGQVIQLRDIVWVPPDRAQRVHEAIAEALGMGAGSGWHAEWHHRLWVGEVDEAGPLARAGVSPGDTIVAIDDVDLRELSQADFWRLLSVSEDFEDDARLLVRSNETELYMVEVPRVLP